MKKLALIGSVLLVLGTMIFFLAYASNGFHMTPPSTQLTEQNETFANLDGIISLRDRHTNVKVGKSPDGQIHLNYFESERVAYEIKHAPNTDSLEIQSLREALPWYSEFFSFGGYHQSATFTILLPDDFTGSLDLATTNGTIEIPNVNANDLTLSSTNGTISLTGTTVIGTLTATTSNELISVTDVAAAGGRITLTTTNAPIELEGVYGESILAKTSNEHIEANNVTAGPVGKIELETKNATITLDESSAGTGGVTATTSNAKVKVRDLLSFGSIAVKTSNGAISVDQIEAEGDISLISSNAKITGEIVGKREDFSVTATTTNANNNLQGALESGGKHHLTVTTSNGNIDISFSPK